MGAQDNIKLVRDLWEATRKRDERRYGEIYADDAVIRVAGVPRGLGGVTQGREQILNNFRQQQAPAGEADIRDIFADDKHACVVAKVSNIFGGTQYFIGTGKPYSTYECIVYDIEGGKVKGQTVYMNFLDVYVQAGLVPLSSLTTEAVGARS